MGLWEEGVIGSIVGRWRDWAPGRTLWEVVGSIVGRGGECWKHVWKGGGKGVGTGVGCRRERLWVAVEDAREGKGKFPPGENNL